MLIGICDRNPRPWLDEFRCACETLGYEVTVIRISSNDWMRQVRDLDLFVWRTVMADASCMAEARTKIPLIEEMGVLCFPSAQMLWLYDDKIRETFFLRHHGNPMPATFISFDEDEARAYARSAQYPIVTKTHNGASSSGVMLLRSPSEADRLLNRIFRGETVIDKALVKYYYQPRLKQGDFMLERQFRARHSTARYAYFQEFVRSTNDWRITTLGSDLVSVFKRQNRPGDFRASGSGLWEQVTEAELPVAPCDIALEISNRHRFSSMAYDFMEGTDGWLIGEISYTFVLNVIYTNTLFRKQAGTYRKAIPIPVGVMHLQAALAHRVPRQVTVPDTAP